MKARSCKACTHYQPYAGPDKRGRMVCDVSHMVGYTDRNGTSGIYHNYDACANSYEGLKFKSDLDRILFSENYK